MAVQKVITEDNRPNNKPELSYDEWIDTNLKNICNHISGRINYVNRKNKSPNRVETEKIIKELSSRCKCNESNTTTIWRTCL